MQATSATAREVLHPRHEFLVVREEEGAESASGQGAGGWCEAQHGGPTWRQFEGRRRRLGGSRREPRPLVAAWPQQSTVHGVHNDGAEKTDAGPGRLHPGHYCRPRCAGLCADRQRQGKTLVQSLRGVPHIHLLFIVQTAAFALPILKRLADDPFGIFAVVVTPTRELAIQIADQFRALVEPSLCAKRAATPLMTTRSTSCRAPQWDSGMLSLSGVWTCARRCVRASAKLRSGSLLRVGAPVIGAAKTTTCGYCNTWQTA